MVWTTAAHVRCEELHRCVGFPATQKPVQLVMWNLSVSLQVGACIVNQENKIVGIGYNGMPNGCDDDLLPWSRSADDRLDTKYPYGTDTYADAFLRFYLFTFDKIRFTTGSTSSFLRNLYPLCDFCDQRYEITT